MSATEVSCDLPIPTLVSTGGPCGGKSTLQAILSQKLGEYGVDVITGPEAATLIFGAGVIPQEVTRPETSERFQEHLTRLMIAIEDQFRSIAALTPTIRDGQQRKKLLNFDRGLMDNEAYIGSEMFSRILGRLGLTEEDARDRRYDMVIHLVSAAEGAEKHYNFNNPNRTESIEDARALDQRTAQAWVQHRNLKIIPNRERVGETWRPISFTEKMDRALQAACRLVDIPVPLSVERKLRLSRTPDLAALPPHARHTLIEQVYLPDRDQETERRIRHILPLGNRSAVSDLYVYTEKHDVRPGVRSTQERIISRRDYLTLLAERDPDSVIVRKRRISFLWEYQYFQLDLFEIPGHVPVLEVETTETNPNVTLPHFLAVDADVTEDPAYRTREIARIR